MVDLEGYLILVVQTVDGKIRLFGSPADHSDLEVGDEIVEVNGETLEGATHAEVISHIHTCIKSRTIQLRVKRSCGENIVPGLNEIQDAYVIAVEEQARQRLEQLSVLHKVRPVDIATVGGNACPVHQLGGGDDDDDDNDYDRRYNQRNHRPPPYSAYIAQAVRPQGPPPPPPPPPPPLPPPSQNNKQNCFLPETSNPLVFGVVGERQGAVVGAHGVPSGGSIDSVASTSGVSGSEEEEDDDDDEEEEEDDDDSRRSRADGPVPAVEGAAVDSVTMDAGSVTNGYVNGHPIGGSVAMEEPRYPMNGALKDANRLSGQGGSATGTAVGVGVGVGVGGPGRKPLSYLERSKENLYEVDPGPTGPDLNESGPHREMAIDCPANFVGKAKEPPRLPATAAGGRGSPKPGSAAAAKRPQEYGSSNTRNWEENITPYREAPAPTMSEQLANEEKVRFYQEELRRQREEKSRQAREEEFLRTSLRGSKKLQALEEQHVVDGAAAAAAAARVLPSGIVNPNFITEEDGEGYAGSRASTLPIGARAHPAFKPTGVEDLFSSIHHIQSRLESVEDQKHVQFLSQLFHNSRFQQALDIHNKVIEVTLRSPQATPVCDNAHQTAADILAAMAPNTGNPVVDELTSLLHRPNIKGLLYSHDRVATQKTQDTKQSMNDDEERDYIYERASQYGEDSIKIVRLQKTADPLGATVRNEGDSVIIGRIVKGGAAEKSGLLHEGDEVLEINGVDMRARSVNDVCELMANMTGTLTFLIVPSEEVQQFANGPVSRDKVVHMRAHFNYDPEDDLYIPCRELGISFSKGDVLHVINQDDPNWWQAYREGEDDQALAGLIPSRTFQQQREAMRQTIAGDSRESTKKKHRCRCAKSSKKKKKKQLYSGAGEDAEAEEILTYEEVVHYNPQPNRKRPIVLIGPPNVGRQDLRQRLMQSDAERFAAAIPHTSRPRRDDEADGIDYHFVPRHSFETGIAGQKFVEHGEFEGNLYGTSLDAIREVINQGRICLLNLHPQSLRILKASDLKPYVVFVAPPNLEKLKAIRTKEGSKITDDDLKDIIEKAREVEETYGHYFDMILVNSDIDKAYEELLAEINRLEIEPQWVPAHWVT